MDTSITATSIPSVDHAIRTADGVIIGPIPLLLYEQISRNYGCGAETVTQNYGNGFVKRRPLDAASSEVGFSGTIGIRKQFDDFYFTLWSRTFEGVADADERDYHARNSEVLVISSGIRRTGVWAYGKGDHLTEANIFSFRTRDTPLFDRSTARAVQFAAAALAWASQMAVETKGYSESFWEADRNPEGDYTEPSS